MPHNPFEFHVENESTRRGAGSMMGSLLAVLCVIVLLPTAFLCLEVALAMLPAKRRDVALAKPRVMVLIPAHNEEQTIVETIESIQRRLTGQDSIVVVADNCSDSTATVARKRGVRVVERNDPEHVGKGYALAFGVDAMRAAPPEVVVVIDADCVPEGDAVSAVASRAAAWSCPVQGAYVLTPPDNPSPLREVSALAFVVKGVVRPTGLSRLGLPCLLAGSGMAFPWDTISKAPLTSDSIVEDLQLGLDLACAGSYPRFHEHARFWSQLPERSAAARIQRRRWEHGHLHTIITTAPKILISGILRRRLPLVTLAMELAVPPLSLLSAFHCVLGVICLTYAAITEDFLAATLSGLNVSLLILSTLAAWLRFGRRLTSVRSLLFAPFYALSKLTMYVSFIGSRERRWQRTPRA